MKPLISPSILSADFSQLACDLQACEDGGADQIHIDVMDGSFVPNISFGSKIVETCKNITRLPLDVHLMIVEPEKHLESFAKAGANRISVHFETCPHIHRTLQTIRELGVIPGITYNPGTPVDSLRFLGPAVDFVLIMSVNPGFGGQEFIPWSLEKIREVRKILAQSNPQAIIQVDGGISAETIKATYLAGAGDFVAGTAVFGHVDGIASGIKALRDALG